MNRGKLFMNKRKGFLTIVNAGILCMGATIVSGIDLQVGMRLTGVRWCWGCIRLGWR